MIEETKEELQLKIDALSDALREYHEVCEKLKVKCAALLSLNTKLIVEQQELQAVVDGYKKLVSKLS